MTVKVKFFASLKDLTGIPESEISARDIKTVSELWDKVTENRPIPDNLLCAVNHQHVSLNHGIRDGDEVAFFPPVTGG